MKVAIIGARRNRNGIGEYIGKYFHKNGATITSVLGTAEKTAQHASSALWKYGIRSTPYSDFYEMVESEKPDTAVIASPSPTHYDYLVKCIHFGLNVFCEKPFIWQETGDTPGITQTILQRANQRNVTVAMNSQWPFSVRYYEEICGPIDRVGPSTFFISMSPLSYGKDMIPESVPHALSILYFVLGDGKIANLHLEHDEEEITIRFRYKSQITYCDVVIHLRRKEGQPRDFCFGFNDRVARRFLDLENYDIYFSYEGRKIKISDPLELSVQDFIEAVKGGRKPLIGYPHIVSNMALLKAIYDSH